MSSIFTHGAADFYFMELIPGSSCADPIWKGVPREQTSRTLLDYAKINIERSKHPLRLTGALHRDKDSGTYTVGPLYTRDITNISPPQFPGPWKTVALKYKWQFDYLLDTIRAGQLYSRQRKKAFLVHRWMKDAVMAYPPYNVEDEDTFPLNNDSNGGHIMVDARGGITGLIDWEGASVGPKCEAFAIPQAFEERLFFDGSNELSWAELELADAYKSLGRPDLAECITLGKPYQWISILIYGGSWHQYKWVKALGVSVGLEMEDNEKDFLSRQRKTYKAEFRALKMMWAEEEAVKAQTEQGVTEGTGAKADVSDIGDSRCEGGMAV